MADFNEINRKIRSNKEAAKIEDYIVEYYIKAKLWVLKYYNIAKAYFLSCTKYQQYAWESVATGTIFVIFALILW